MRTFVDYQSPEIIFSNSDSLKSDIWALGIILYRLVSLRRSFPFPEFQPFAPHVAMDRAFSEYIPNPLPSKFSSFFKILIGMLLEKEPEDRPSAE